MLTRLSALIPVLMVLIQEGQSVGSDLCMPNSLMKTYAGDKSKYYACFDESSKWGSQIGTWQLQFCASGEEFVESRQKCINKSRVRKQYSMCGRNPQTSGCESFQPCGAVNVNPVAGGSCNWQTASLAPSPVQQHQYMQCQPQPQQSCGSWQPQQCQPDCNFDQNLQLCVQNQVQQQQSSCGPQAAPVCGCSAQNQCPGSSSCNQGTCCQQQTAPVYHPQIQPQQQFSVSVSACPGNAPAQGSCGQSGGCPSDCSCNQGTCCPNVQQPMPVYHPQPVYQPQPVQQQYNAQFSIAQCPGNAPAQGPCGQTGGCPSDCSCNQGTCCPIQQPQPVYQPQPQTHQQPQVISFNIQAQPQQQQQPQPIYHQQPMVQCPTGVMSNTPCSSGCPQQNSCYQGSCCPQAQPQPIYQPPPPPQQQIQLQVQLQSVTCPSGVQSSSPCSQGCAPQDSCVQGSCCPQAQPAPQPVYLPQPQPIVQNACPAQQAPVCQCASNNACPAQSSCGDSGLCCAQPQMAQPQQQPNNVGFSVSAQQFQQQQCPGAPCQSANQCAGASTGCATCQQNSCQCTQGSYSNGASCVQAVAQPQAASWSPRTCCNQFGSPCAIRFSTARRSPVSAAEEEPAEGKEPVFYRPAETNRTCDTDCTCTPEEVCVAGKCLRRMVPGEYGCTHDRQCSYDCGQSYCHKKYGQCLCKDGFAFITFRTCFAKCPKGTAPTHDGRCKNVVTETKEAATFWNNKKTLAEIDALQTCGSVPVRKC